MVPAPNQIAWDELDPARQREQIVSDAEGMMRANRFQIGNRYFPYDCSGFVGAVFYKNGIDIFRGAAELNIRGNGVKIIRDFLEKYGTLYETTSPHPGDLVFFSNTYDKNRDGRLNDAFTHIGIIERIDSDGTVTFINLVNDGMKKYAMNLSKPQTYKREDDKVVNDYLRRRGRLDRATTPRLAGEMFAGFASIVKTASLPTLTEEDSSSTTAAP